MVQVPVLGKLANPVKKNFGKPKLSSVVLSVDSPPSHSHFSIFPIYLPLLHVWLIVEPTQRGVFVLGLGTQKDQVTMTYIF